MRTMSRLAGAVMVAVLAATAAARPHAQQVLATGSLQVFDTYLEALRQQAGIPGMSAALVKDGAIIWEKGYGFQNVGARQRATPDTPYLVGDLSQTIAAVLLLECVEQRHVDLDAAVTRYGVALPDEPDTTVRQLMTHASPPGAKDPFAYNPARFDTLTTVTEACIPQPYRKSVSHRVLNRLAMTDSVPGTDLLDPEFKLPPELYTDEQIAHYREQLAKLAIPYHLVRGRPDAGEIPRVGMTAATGLVTTVRDLAQLDAALDTDVLLLQETRDAAWTNAAGRDGNPLPTGLGWFVQAYRNERIVWHFGLIPGAYSSLMVKVPGRHLTLILLANSDGLSAPFDLAAGDLTHSVFANLFLRLAI